MQYSPALFVIIALVGSAALSAPSAAQDTQQKQDLKKQDTVPPGGSAGGPTPPDQNAKQEGSSKIEGTSSISEILVNGALTVPGASTDVSTIPSKFSARAAAEDKLPIAAYTFKHLTDEQRKTIRVAVGGAAASGSGSRAIGGYAMVGAQIPTTVALENLRPLPAITQLPEMKEIAFTLSEDKVLLVNPRTRMVIGVLE